jgi:hypothetical protein
MSKWINAGKTR